MAADNFIIKVYEAFPVMNRAKFARFDSISSLELDRCKQKISRLSIDRMVIR
jgi:hypothetical protein